jgi:hypothetical protein
MNATASDRECQQRALMERIDAAIPEYTEPRIAFGALLALIANGIAHQYPTPKLRAKGAQGMYELLKIAIAHYNGVDEQAALAAGGN